jgi:hypothetical protein
MRRTACRRGIYGGGGTFAALGFLLIFSGYSYCAEYSMGKVTSAILLQERLNLTVADKAVVSVGVKDGLIKGDILTITPSPDIGMTNPIAECAVISLVGPGSSVCQIIKARVEVQRGNFVSIEKLNRVDERFYPLLYNMLSKTVDPYEPYKKINVYIHEIFDQGNNVTVLSKRIKGGLEGIFAQKKRIRLLKGLDAKDFRFYPGSYRDTSLALNQVMDRSGVDVLITGAYTVSGGMINLTLYRFDSHYGEEGMTFTTALTSMSDISDASEIVIPMRPVERKEYVSAKVSLKTRQHVPGKDELGDIIANEGNGDVFTINTLKRIGFNIISPVNVMVKLDNEKLNFSGKDDILLPAVEKGVHRITVSFRRGYYANNRNSLLYSSARHIEKEMMVSIDRDGDVFMEVSLDPSLEKQNIDFKVFRQRENRRLLLRPIQSVEAGRPIEFFKD